MTPPAVGLILDIQHQNRASKPGDLGAAYDLDSDGHPGEPGEREVDLVLRYATAAFAYAADRDVQAVVLIEGEYEDRHWRAIKIARENPGIRWAYLACHTNAGGGQYALVRPDYRSRGGLAAPIGIALGTLPGITQVRYDPLYPTAMAAKANRRDVSTADKAAWWTRGWPCIDGIYQGPSNICGVLAEPLFGDSREHMPLTTPEGLARVGRALVDGVIAWGASGTVPAAVVGSGS